MAEKTTESKKTESKSEIEKLEHPRGRIPDQTGIDQPPRSGPGPLRGFGATVTRPTHTAFSNAITRFVTAFVISRLPGPIQSV